MRRELYLQKKPIKLKLTCTCNFLRDKVYDHLHEKRDFSGCFFLNLKKIVQLSFLKIFPENLYFSTFLWVYKKVSLLVFCFYSKLPITKSTANESINWRCFLFK